MLGFPAFDARHAGLAGRLARAVTEHATPVGSGTVARTRRIPVERRAGAAVIAWMRHRTTAYEGIQAEDAHGALVARRDAVGRAGIRDPGA